jgi:glyoxylase I family protein
MIHVKTIDHIVLRTDRVEEMVNFYCRILNCTVERTLPEEVGLSQLQAGNALIDIVAVDSKLGRAGGEAPSPTGNNLDHFCLQIEPFEESELLDYLSSHGIETSDFEVRYGAQGFGPSIYIKDPDGNTIELKASKSPK